jgi:hypothetical protein
MTTVQITLPDQLAADARRAGLLTPQAIEALLREAVERRRIVDDLFAAIERVQAAGPPPMSEDEVQAEIDAARADRRSRDPGRSR